MSSIDRSRLTRRIVLAASASVVATSAHAQLGDLLKGLGKDEDDEVPAKPQVTQAAGVQNLAPRGYSEQFLPVRTEIAQGQYADALKLFEPDPHVSKRKSGVIVTDPFLQNVEAGLLELENGAPDHAQACFQAANDSASGRAAKDTNSVGDALSSTVGWLAGKVTGQEEIEDYHALDHERILQLNYMTLAFLLQGDRHCYNVTRGCIDEQTQLKAKFDKEIEEYKKKYAEQTSDKDKLSDGDRASANLLSDQYKADDHVADRVPNAYINPLADYLAGVIQEVVSHEEPALRDNSRIAYSAAAKLCGVSPQLSAAAKAMARPRVPAGERVLHVVVAEGFAPARQVMTFGFGFKGQVVPIRVPIFKPVPSSISRIVVRTGKGRVLDQCDPIGDFEAIRMRDQHDRIPEIMLSVLSSILASVGAAKATEHMGVFGLALRDSRESTAQPDTRSWLSLPRRFHVARVALPAGVHSVELVAYDGANRERGKSAVELSADEPQSFLYARATDSGIRLQSTRRLWIDGRLEEVAK